MTQINGNLESWQLDVEKWKTDLAFCRDEIKILRRYLEDVDARPLSSEMKEDIAHFHARLSDAMEKSAFLLLEVTEYGHKLSALPFNEKNTEAYSHTKEKTLAFCKSYTGLKSTFVKFLAKSDIIA